MWRRATINLRDETLEGVPRAEVVTELVFEGIKGTGYESDIAIDDIFVKDGVCEGILLLSLYEIN